MDAVKNKQTYYCPPTQPLLSYFLVELGFELLILTVSSSQVLELQFGNEDTEVRICEDCSLKIREPEVPAPWFLDPGGWSKTAAVGLYFIFPGICTLSLFMKLLYAIYKLIEDIIVIKKFHFSTTAKVLYLIYYLVVSTSDAGENIGQCSEQTLCLGELLLSKAEAGSGKYPAPLGSGNLNVVPPPIGIIALAALVCVLHRCWSSEDFLEIFWASLSTGIRKRAED
ncbi:hypothetical protein STEG23_014084 [Scotinomys teguina]